MHRLPVTYKKHHLRAGVGPEVGQSQCYRREKAVGHLPGRVQPRLFWVTSADFIKSPQKMASSEMEVLDGGDEVFPKADPIADLSAAQNVVVNASEEEEDEIDVEALEARLVEQAQFDEVKHHSLEDLLAANEEVRKQNSAIEHENLRLQHTLDLDTRRHKEIITEALYNEMYDWIVDVQLLSDVSRTGWRVEFNDRFLNRLGSSAREQLKSDRAWRSADGQIVTDGLGRPEAVGWAGAVVAVLGLYDKGKTFLLNHLTESKLPSGKKVATKGLSFKHVELDGGSEFILLDSEGSYSPVKVTDELSVVEKEATEHFLQELIFEMSDYFLCVVNDFTSLDQRYLDKLTRNLQNSNKDFREVIVVHNCKEVVDEDTLRHVWETQVIEI